MSMSEVSVNESNIYAMILAAAVLDPQLYLEVPPGFGFGLKVLN